MSLAFLIHPPLFSKRHQSPVFKCHRTPFIANINSTGDTAREDEIAAKISNLRKQKRLKSQRQTSSDSSDNADKPDVGKQSSFHDLPDWKKEQILQDQMTQAEAFLNPSSMGDKSPSAKAAGEKYKPKVSTWGVFPRPDNISQTYGGGKSIKKGGVDLESEASKQRDEAVAKKLAEYRAARGIDIEREERHREEIEQALEKAAVESGRSQPYKAIQTLQPVVQYVSDASRLGGSLYLALALAYDTVGRRDDAREIYIRLRRSAFPEINGKAKQLLQGFEAMDMLKVQDETRDRGFRVTDFQLPDISSGVERRYETAVTTQTSQRSEKVDNKTNALLVALILAPIAFVFLVIIPLQHR